MKCNMNSRLFPFFAWFRVSVITKAELDSFESLSSGLSSFMNAEKYPTAYLGIDKL